MDNCSCCFTDYLAACETQIRLNIILPPYAEYRWVITDKFDKKYQGDLLSDDDGYYIPVTDLPDGLLTEYSGDFKLQIFPIDESCGPVSFKIAGLFNCISFDVHGGNFQKNNLGCDFDCPSGSSDIIETEGSDFLITE